MSFESIDRLITETLTELCLSQGITRPKIVLEIPRQREFGDLSSNVAMTAAAKCGMSPYALADKLAAAFTTSADGVEKVEVAGPGFLNFHLAPDYFHRLLAEVVHSPGEYGDGDEGGGARWLFEFVSANPTGPLNVVSARAASIGDSLVKVFRKRGYQAESEFYVNDGGGQVALLGASAKARLNEIEGRTEVAVIPEGGYHGDYVIDMANAWRTAHPGEELPDDELTGRWTADLVREGQEETLRRFRVTFDRWFRESEVYADDRPDAVVRKLKDLGLAYEKDGALFFTASRFGDEKDRVLVTSDGRFTYVVPDLAYHLDKRTRGFDRAVDLLGPDHHGHSIQIQAGLKALGLSEEFLQVMLVQQVNLKRGGQEVKMSKRAGVGITLDELVEEVGVDAARFFFLMRKSSSPLDFDIDLARRHSEDNPVYYIQYANARIRSILRHPDAFEPGDDVDLTSLVEPEEMDLLRAVARFPWTLSAVVRGIEPHPITVYLTDLARTFHLFYQRRRVIGDDRRLTAARLTLCRGVAGVLAEGLRLIGVEAPDRM